MEMRIGESDQPRQFCNSDLPVRALMDRGSRARWIRISSGLQEWLSKRWSTS